MGKDGLKQAIVRFRIGLPGSLRRAVRIVRAAFSSAPQSPKLPQELLENCRFCADRLLLIDRLPRGGEVAEIGTLRGEFARLILKISNPRKLYLIDLDFSKLVGDVRDDPRVSLHQGSSPDILSVIANESLDWAYIDADHSYRGASRDAAAAARKIKPGGYLVFNDFAHIDPSMGRYGVHRAVVEFAVANRWPLVLLAYETNALYDVALQRPGGDSGRAQ